MDDETDALVRDLIHEHLGVLPEDLSPEVSLVDDLAVDSLDLCEVGIALEERLGVAFPRGAMDQVRTYGDLLATTLGALRDRRRQTHHPVPIVRTRLVAATEPRTHTVRAGGLSPYETQLIADDARRAGPGSQLTIELVGTSDPSSCDNLRGELAWLTRRGVRVRVRCDRGGCRHGAAA